MKKIIVIECPGSGKTTFSKNLAKKRGCISTVRGALCPNVALFCPNDD